MTAASNVFFLSFCFSSDFWLFLILKQKEKALVVRIPVSTRKQNTADGSEIKELLEIFVKALAEGQQYQVM